MTLISEERNVTEIKRNNDIISFKVTIGGPMIKRVTDDAREDEMEENLGQVSLKHVINHSKGSKMTKIDLTAPYWLMIMDSVTLYS